MKPKSNSVVTVAQTEAGMILVTVLNAGVVEFDPSKAHASNRKHAEFHGWKQRLSDAAAMSRDPANGAAATPKEKMEAIAELAEHYMSGSEEWSRAGGGGGAKSLTIEAIARVQGISYEDADAQVTAMAAEKKEDRKKTLAFLGTGARVMAAMKALRDERMPAPVVDADEALNALKAA